LFSCYTNSSNCRHQNASTRAGFSLSKALFRKKIWGPLTWGGRSYFLLIIVASIHFTRSLRCRPLFPACCYVAKKLPLPLWGLLSVGAPVWPNMVNMPKSAAGVDGPNAAHAVASPGLVSPGAVTDGVTPYFFPEKTDDPFWSSLSSLPPPLEGVTPHHFYLYDLICPLFSVNSATKKISFGCHLVSPSPFPKPLSSWAVVCSPPM